MARTRSQRNPTSQPAREVVEEEEAATELEAPPEKEVPSKREAPSKKAVAAKKETAPKKEAAAKKEASSKKEPASKKETVVAKEDEAPKRDDAAKKEAAPKRDGVPKKRLATGKEVVSKKKVASKKIEVVPEKEVASGDDVASEEEAVSEKEVANEKEVVAEKEILSDKDILSDEEEEVDSQENNVSEKREAVPEEEPLPEQQQVVDFSQFKLTKVIDESTLSKFITLLGTYKGENAVIRLEKTSFNQDDITKALKDKIGSERDFINDIYSSYTLSSIETQNPTNNLRATVIWPANRSVLAKYTRAEHIILSETPDTYLKFVEPYIANKLNNEKDYNQWVYNILEGKSEAERVIFNDTDKDSGFMLVPDLKWSGDTKDLNLLAICHRRDIRSLRDLNDKHLILLKNILTQGTKAIKNKYKKLEGQLRTFVHYQPSFYHFHVHFKVVDASDYKSTDRDNLLNTIINNISLMGDYYKKSTLTYPLSRSNDLYQVLKLAKRV